MKQHDLAICSDQVSDFVEIVYAAIDDLVEVRLLPARASYFYFAEQLKSDKVVESLYQQNLDGQNIYVGANPRSMEGGRGSKDVDTFRCVFVDWDGIDVNEARRRIGDAAIALPSMIVASGHGVHAWWRLDTPPALATDFGVEEWGGIQRGLIRALDSDEKIKDAARIMRLPGFLNVKRDPHVPCRIIEAHPGRRYLPDDLGVEPIASSTRITLVAAGKVPHPRTREFIASGAAEGDRNARLFQAAADLHGRDYSLEQAMIQLAAAAARCGLSDDEISNTINSAYSQSRTPALSDQELITALIEKQQDPDSDGPGMISNVVWQDIGGKRPEPRYVPIVDISHSLKGAIGENGLARINGLLFTVEGEQVRLLSGVDSLFAWIQEHARVDWIAGKRIMDPVMGQSCSPVNRREFYEHCRDTIQPDYETIERLPHDPPLGKSFYIGGKLPPADGTALAELAERLNPATELDRDLMLAALITPGWGGPPGARPAFVLMNELASQSGVGAGKTSTAQLFAEMWGGSISLRPDESWDRALGRLLSDDALLRRCVIIDNLKGKLSSGSLESSITSRSIDGHRMYHGQYRRPNVLTWYLTANTPDLSRDLADRCVLIHVGAPQHASTFAAWAEDFIATRQEALVADVMAWLRQPPRCELSAALRDRWSTWGDAILSRFETGNDMLEKIKMRRPEVDADLESANEIADGICDFITSCGHDPQVHRVSIAKTDLFNALHKRGQAYRSSNVLTRKIHQLKGIGDLRHLVEANRHGKSRRWLWEGPGSAPTDPVLDADVEMSNRGDSYSEYR